MEEKQRKRQEVEARRSHQWRETGEEVGKKGFQANGNKAELRGDTLEKIVGMQNEAERDR